MQAHASTSRSLASAGTRGAGRGFSLIEVMASAAILALGMAAVIALFSHLSASYSHQRLQVQALHVAEATLEDLLLRYSDDDDLTPGTHTGPGFAIDGSPGGTFFSTSWEVTMDVPFTGAREVVVTVTWAEQGHTKTFLLKTVRT